ncbi:hypothetical protein LINPERPRIM_LOCUS12383 [Linum perenne]
MTARITFMLPLSSALRTFSVAIGRFALRMFFVRVITLLTILLIEVIPVL